MSKTIEGTIELETQKSSNDVEVLLYSLESISNMPTSFSKNINSLDIDIAQLSDFFIQRHSPVSKTMTDQNGYYKFSNIPKGSYILVAIKNGFGWKVRGFININGTAVNLIMENIILYPETEIRSDIEDECLFLQNHHYIINGEITVKENATLIIEEGAVIRFGETSKLLINGKIDAIGEKNNPILFIDNNLDDNNSPDGIVLKTTLSCSFVYSNFQFLSQSIKASNCILNLKKCQFLNITGIALYLYGESIAEISSNVFLNCHYNIKTENINDCVIEKNLFFTTTNVTSYGIYSLHSFLKFVNNYFYAISYPINLQYGSKSIILCNGFTNCVIAVLIIASQITMENNTINSTTDYAISLDWPIDCIFRHNNFINVTKAIVITGVGASDIDARNNFWETSNKDEIFREIKDVRINPDGMPSNFLILIDPVDRLENSNC